MGTSINGEHKSREMKLSGILLLREAQQYSNPPQPVLVQLSLWDICKGIESNIRLPKSATYIKRG